LCTGAGLIKFISLFYYLLAWIWEQVSAATNERSKFRKKWSDMRFKQVSREGDMKFYYKLFKAGKQLVNAPIGKLALTSAVLFTIALGGVNADTDTTGSADPTSTQTSFLVKWIKAPQAIGNFSIVCGILFSAYLLGSCGSAGSPIL